MPHQQPVRIDVVSDVVCPWCFIGKHRLEKALALKPDIRVEVRWRPYFLNDWVPREGISRDEYLTTKFGSPERYKAMAGRVQQAAAAEGLTYAMDKISRQPNTTDAHRLIRWAAGIGKAAEMKQKLMDLYFTEGANLTNPAYVFAIGLGGNSVNGPPDPILLQRIANDPNGDTFNASAYYSACALETGCSNWSGQYQGTFVYAPTSAQLSEAFIKISSQILRLAK